MVGDDGSGEPNRKALPTDETEQLPPSHEEDTVDRIDIELDRIRERRENPGKRFLVNTIFPQTFDDYTLVFGIISGMVFFGLISVASSGLVLGESIKIDESLSGTPLDSSECTDRRGELWIHTWVDQDNDLRIVSHNVPYGSPSAIFASIQNETMVLASNGDI